MTQDLRKSIEAWIKKTQEKFFKNLEVLKNKQTDEQDNNWSGKKIH